MDQTTYIALLKSFVSRCTTDHKIRDLTAVPGPANAPVVVLVHGIGGNAHHWSNPAGLNVNETWLFNLDAEPAPAGSGILSSPPYAAGAVTPWSKFLQTNQITFINYSQAHPNGQLDHAVAELAALLRVLEQTVFAPYEQDVKANKGNVPPLIILCHSRGGLVTRGALKQLGRAGVPHLRKVISLTTPHHGSYMPRLANDYNQQLKTEIDFSALAQRLPGLIRPFFERAIDRYVDTLANDLREAILHSFGTLAQGPGFDELLPDSRFMQTLAQGEQPIPGVHYVGYGGSNPVFVKFYLSGLGQAFYLLSAIGSFVVERMSIIPGVMENYGGMAELVKGDSAVALTSSRWPAVYKAQHQDLAFNHMQALIDPALQKTVLQVIRA